jgi:polar amino acid transport system permease protein
MHSVKSKEDSRDQVSSPRGEVSEESYPIVPRRHIAKIAASVIVAGIALALLISVVLNENLRWDVVAEYFTGKTILEGIFLTLWLTVVCMVLGTMLGAVIGIMRMSKNRLLTTIAGFYVWFFRATPVLVQLIFWFNLSALYPTLGIELPFGISFLQVETNAVMTPIVAAILCLTLNEAAYMAEITRGGFLGVDPGQTEAAKALGMGRFNTLRILIPQAMRMIIPPTGNQLISLLKATSLVSVVGIADLLHSAQLIYAANYLTIPLLTVAGLWYLFITSVLSFVQSRLERRLARGFATRNGESKRKLKTARPIAALQESNNN